MPEIQFESFRDFIAMGGYGFYVWWAYFLFALTLAWNLIQPRLERRKVLKLLKARMQREAEWNERPARQE